MEKVSANYTKVFKACIYGLGASSLIFVVLPICVLILIFLSAEIHHNGLARDLLVELKTIPLPADSHVIKEGIDVGNLLADTGNNTDIAAYRVFTTKAAPVEIEKAFPAQSAEDPESLVELFVLGKAKNSPEQKLSDNIEASPGAYVIYRIERIDTSGTWDLRGW